MRSKGILLEGEPSRAEIRDGLQPRCGLRVKQLGQFLATHIAGNGTVPIK